MSLYVLPSERVLPGSAPKGKTRSGAVVLPVVVPRQADSAPKGKTAVAAPGTQRSVAGKCLNINK